MICERYDVVVVPFPFSDRASAKRRPALVLSGRWFNREGHTVMAMLTTKKTPPWPADTPLVNFQSAGLKVSCIVRFKILTLDNRLILKKIGRLAEGDAEAVSAHLHSLLGGD